MTVRMTMPTISLFVISAALATALFHADAVAETAKDNYRFYCAQCHGAGGKGDGPNALESMPVAPRDHTNASEMSKLTDEDVINAIADGGASVSKSSLMPPFSKTLTKKEIIELKDYVRRLCKCKAK